MYDKGKGKFCSNCCSTKHWGEKQKSRAKLKCQNCGGEFEVIRSNSYQKCFSTECVQALKRKSHNSVKVRRTCIHCAKVFFEYPSRIKGGRGKFCSTSWRTFYYDNQRYDVIQILPGHIWFPLGHKVVDG